MSQIQQVLPNDHGLLNVRLYVTRVLLVLKGLLSERWQFVLILVGYIIVKTCSDFTQVVVEHGGPLQIDRREHLVLYQTAA